MAELRELSYAECRALLVRQRAGRVAVSTADGPHIIPLNYSVVDESIVFRTTPFSVLATYGRNAKLAFEVDHFHDEHRLGWSVVARGRADVVSDPDELNRIRRICAPLPWADGARNLYFRLPWKELSGRTLGRETLEDLLDGLSAVAAGDHTLPGLQGGGPRLRVAPEDRA
jgi:nitroimidazol reductase NimA-like FMN-containing flavoprotein (pyridoxamine 5'-phosphate oxidase superfamily)